MSGLHGVQCTPRCFQGLLENRKRGQMDRLGGGEKARNLNWAWKQPAERLTEGLVCAAPQKQPIQRYCCPNGGKKQEKDQPELLSWRLWWCNSHMLCPSVRLVCSRCRCEVITEKYVGKHGMCKMLIAYCTFAVFEKATWFLFALVQMWLQINE